MKKLSEFKDDEAMDVLAEVIEPVAELCTDKEFVQLVRGDKSKGIKPDRIKATQKAITDHRKAVVKIMAVLNETPVEEFHYNIMTLPMMFVKMLNDKELLAFFQYQGETDLETRSGSAMANIEENPNTSSDM